MPMMFDLIISLKRYTKNTRYSFNLPLFHQILIQIQSSTTSKTRLILVIPSYFDFVRVRNYLKEHSYVFSQISEYTSGPDISRARKSFFDGEINLLVITERVHFFKR